MSTHRRLYDPGWLVAQYVDRRRTQRDIAGELGCSRQSVANALKRYGITSDWRGPAPAVHPRLDDVAWLREQYLAEGRSTTQIADELGVAQKTVHRWLRRHGLPTRPRRGDALNDSADDSVTDTTRLCRQP